MSNTLYDSARTAFALGEINWESDAFRVMLVSDNGYSPDTSSHTTLGDVASGSILATASLGSCSVSAGACDGGDVTFTSVESDDDVTYIIIYKYVSSTADDNPLIAIIDTATGLPITPNGGDIIVTWDSGTNKIFRL